MSIFNLLPKAKVAMVKVKGGKGLPHRIAGSATCGRFHVLCNLFVYFLMYTILTYPIIPSIDRPYCQFIGITKAAPMVWWDLRATEIDIISWLVIADWFSTQTTIWKLRIPTFTLSMYFLPMGAYPALDGTNPTLICTCTHKIGFWKLVKNPSK